MHEARAEQGTSFADEVRGNHRIVRVQLPEEGDRVEDLLRVVEGAVQGSVALKVLLRDAVENSVAPGLPFIPVATWRTNVSGVGDVYGRTSGCWEAAVTNETSGVEVRGWRWCG